MAFLSFGAGDIQTGILNPFFCMLYLGYPIAARGTDKFEFEGE